MWLTRSDTIKKMIFGHASRIQRNTHKQLIETIKFIRRNYMEIFFFASMNLTEFHHILYIYNLSSLSGKSLRFNKYITHPRIKLFNILWKSIAFVMSHPNKKTPKKTPYDSLCVCSWRATGMNYCGTVWNKKIFIFLNGSNYKQHDS